MDLLANADAWAVPVNTALLVILSALGIIAARERQGRKRDITDIKNYMGLTRRHYDKPSDTRPKDSGRRRRGTDKERRTSDRVSVSSKADSEVEN